MLNTFRQQAVMLLAVTGLAFSTQSNADVPPLTVNGSQIQVGGEHIGLAGNSFFWSNEGYGAERFYNASVVDWLKTDWQSKIVRAAMGVEEFGGYITHPEQNRTRVETIVDAAIDEDLYVIIDWHSHHAENYQAQAISFFQDMARKYGDNNNVIYEVYNEPIHVSWSGTVKPYAEAVIAAIREIDPDNLVIVGSPTWSQDVHEVAADPITRFDNIAYTLHFYAGTHTEFLRDRAERAMNDGIAIMVTEWGTVNADGNGAVDVAETNRWVEWMDQYNLTHLNWSVHDKDEGASVIRPGAATNGGWTASSLTTSGAFVRDIVRDYNQGVEISTDSTTSFPSPVEPDSTVNISSDATVVTMQKRNTSFSVDGGRGAQSGLQVYLWSTDTDNVNQQWLELDRGNGYYSYQKQNTSLCLDGGNGGAQRQAVILFNCSDRNQNQQWRKVSTASGSFRLEKRNASGFSIDGNRGAAARQLIYLWNSNSGNVNQQWEFITDGNQVVLAPESSPTVSRTVDSEPIVENTPQEATSCEFIIVNEWSNGFVGEVRITNNTSSAISNSWSINFQFTDGSQVVNSWNSTLEGSNPYTIEPLSWNRSIPVNGTTTFGIQSNKGRANSPAQAPVVNGSVCN